MSRGRQFRGRIYVQQKATSVAVDDRRALAAQRFGRERRRIGVDVDGGRVELHELCVGDDCARARRHGDADAARLHGIGRHPIKMTDAAGRQHQRRTGNVADAPRGVARAHGDDAAVARDDLLRRIAVDHRDGRRLRELAFQRLHDGAAGGVAHDAHHASMRMRRLLRGREGAAVTAIEGRAHGGEIVDAVARLPRHAERDIGVDDAAAGCDCILGVPLSGVAFVDRRRNAALRPE